MILVYNTFVFYVKLKMKAIENSSSNSLGILVYRIPYRRTWSGGRVRARAKVSCIQLTYSHCMQDTFADQARRVTIWYLVYNPFTRQITSV